jgi:membrane protease YdiL (CAAX protease family)
MHPEPIAEPSKIPSTKPDGLRVAIQVVLFVLAFFFVYVFVGQVLVWIGIQFAGPPSTLIAAGCASWLGLRAFHDMSVISLGLWWNRLSADNLALGLAGGMGSALVVLVPPLLVGAARVEKFGPFSWGDTAFVLVFLAIGVVGEELLCRGFPLQVLLPRVGALATVIFMGLLFGLIHAFNPNATRFSVANTAGFGVLFGYAYVRSRDLWLSIGLHFGWNLTLPLFGANLSGIKIINEVTGLRMVWKAGGMWSGGEYGPENSILTTAVLLFLFLYLWKAPIRRQHSPLTDPPKETVCEPSRS